MLLEYSRQGLQMGVWIFRIVPGQQTLEEFAMEGFSIRIHLPQHHLSQRLDHLLQQHSLVLAHSLGWMM